MIGAAIVSAVESDAARRSAALLWFFALIALFYTAIRRSDVLAAERVESVGTGPLLAARLVSTRRSPC
jgi:hypothetical protein